MKPTGIKIPSLALACAIILAWSLPGRAALQGDSLDTAKGPLVIHPLVHATFVMAWNGELIYFDPVGGKSRFGDIPPADAVFITHDHPDHLDVPTLQSVTNPETTIVAPKAVFDKLPETLQKQTHVMANGDTWELDGFKVEAVAMYNLPPNNHHPKGRGNGYVLTLGGRRVYVSGDTDGTPEMRALKNIDMAFVCMNPPYTMSVEQAADAVLAFKPRIVYPYHYRSPGGLNDIQKFKRLVSVDKNIQVRLRNWYPNQPSR